MEHETYKMVRWIAQNLRPLASLATTAARSAEEDGERLLSILEAIIEGQVALRHEVEALNARLTAPEVDRLLQNVPGRP
jgi:hypothetical protein